MNRSRTHWVIAGLAALVGALAALLATEYLHIHQRRPWRTQKPRRRVPTHLSC